MITMKRVAIGAMMGMAALVACNDANTPPPSNPNATTTNNSGGFDSPATQQTDNKTQLPVRGNSQQGTFGNGTQQITTDGTSSQGQTTGVNGTGLANMGGTGSTTTGGSGNNGVSNTGGGAGRKTPDNGPNNSKDAGAK